MIKTQNLLWVLCIVLLGQCSDNRPTEGEKDGYDFSPITEKVQYWVNRGYYPGAAVLIAKDNQVVYEDYFGSYDSNTVVYIASAGKWLASATIASVVEKTDLDWDNAVSRWLPEFSDVKGTATLTQLMSHTSGFPDYQPEGNHPDDYQTLKESVKNIAGLSADTIPGAEFHYGGLAMQVAGRMAELASGQNFETLFQENIATPLGMKNTHFVPVDPTNGHNPMIGGGARSTLHDYARFLEMVLNNGIYKGKRILEQESIVRMETDQVKTASVNPGEFVQAVREANHNGVYGLGLWCEELDGNNHATLISSPGWAGAYPWVDRTNQVYGFMLTHVVPEKAFPEGFSSFLNSPMLATMTRDILQKKNDIVSGFVPVENGSLYYEMKGSGEPLILLHGHSFDRRMWDKQFDTFSDHFQVIRYDLRGYGRSTEPDSGQTFMHVNDLIALMDQLNIQKANLVGVSLGSFVIADMLALFPDRIQTAVMASGAVYDCPGPSTPVSPEEIGKRMREIELLKSTGIHNYKKNWFNSLMKGTGSNGESNRQPMWEMIYQWTAWQPLNIEPRLLLGNEVLDTLGDITVPVLFIYSGLDSEGSHRSSDRLAQKIAHAKKVWIENAGHMSNMEQPRIFNQIVFDFIDNDRDENK